MKKWMYVATAVALCGAVTACGSKKGNQASTAGQSPEALNGSWIISLVDGKKVVSEDPAFISFDMTQNKLHGNNGCNIINGGVSAETNGSISFGQVISTMRACMNSNSEAEIMKALNDTRSYKISTDNKGDVSLFFMNADKKQVLTLTKDPASSLQGKWNVVLIDGKSLTDDQKPYMELDMNNKKITGSTGCNRMNGGIITDSENSYAISFDRVATTRMACPGNTEQNFLNAFNTVTSFKILPAKNGKEFTGLCNASGKIVITLEKSK